ncbi:hypothetical protein M405DRAFT_826869 [Rhizopogon salebrosus TDB-379]|nr:hypothetical protein M405DRAFT_826869 [Rhizopogon salebrosus TDB-379]
MSASFAETNHDTSLCIDNSDSFQAREFRLWDAIKSDRQILHLKKQRAQAEVEMFSEAMARTAGLEDTNHGMSSGSAAMYGSDADDDSLDEQFENWSSTSS